MAKATILRRENAAIQRWWETLMRAAKIVPQEQQ